MRQVTFADAIEMLVVLRDQTSISSTDEHLAFLAFCLANIGRSRSQFLQDLWVAYELKSPQGGFFVEFGGTDGIALSNSYLLETQFGWRGVIAEPARLWYPALRQNRACAIDERCVWTRSGQRVVFNQAPTPEHSTIAAYSDSDLLAPSRRGGLHYEVETVTLDDLLAFWNAPRRIDYLSIDTEGSELDILKGFDFSARDVRLITVEHNFSDTRGPILDLLTAQGYRRKFTDLSKVDDWYVKVD
jgi:FkbM family methyltransferase